MKLTEAWPALAATSLGLAPAAIHRATAVCRRSWMRSPVQAGRPGRRQPEAAPEQRHPQRPALRAGEHQILGRARPRHPLGQGVDHEPREADHPPAGAGLGRAEVQPALGLGNDLDHLDGADLQVDPAPAQPDHLADAQATEGPE
jgi:hypothetical protein